MRKINSFIFCSLIFILSTALSFAEETKNILMVLAPAEFADIEYTTPRSIFEQNGYNITVASTKKGSISGSNGSSANSDLAFSDVNVADYAAIVIIGGMGIINEWNNPALLTIVKEACKQGKIVAAICAAPGILINAGVVTGKNITYHPGIDQSELSLKSAARKAKAKVLKKSVVRDGNIITGNGPDAAAEFAQTIVTALS